MANENITAPVEGQAFVNYELLLPSSNTLGLNSSIVRFDSAHISENVYGYGVSDLAIHTVSADYADRVLKALEANGTPLLRFRLGTGTSDNVVWSPWQLHYVKRYSGLFEGVGPTAGHFINLHTVDILGQIDRSSRTSAHRGKVSDIVTKIADRNGISDRVIEPTDTEGLWIQSYCGDFDFVRRRMVRIARSTRGRGNYLFFMRDNVLHFHTVDYQSEVKNFAYYNSAASRLEMTDLPQERISAGSAGVRLVGHDPYTGQSQEVNSVPGNATRFSNWISRLDNVSGAQRNFPFHLSENRGLEAVNLAQNMYESARAETYRLRFQTSKTRPLRAGDILNIDLDPKSGQSSTWSGLWLVASAEHLVRKSQLTSVYILHRGELTALKGQSNALLDQGINLLEDEQNAPGYDLNLQTARASQLTTGSGVAVGNGVYRTVQDTNLALAPEG